MGRGAASRVLIVSAFAGMLLLPGCRRAQPPGGQAGASASDPGILVLSDSDRNRTMPPYEYMIHILDSQGRTIRTLTGHQTAGPSRAISVSDDGETFVVCKSGLSAYQTRTGTQIWSLSGSFDAAVLAGGSIYALATKPTPYSSISGLHSDSLVVVDGTGAIVKQAQLGQRLGGSDIAVDPARKTLWLVGPGIKKCTLDLEVLATFNPVSSGAVSVDVACDGSIWVAEREFWYGQRNRNRLLQLSPEGALQQEIPLKSLSPLCVRVDRSDGSVWMTGLVLRKGVVWSNLLRWPPRWITVDKPAGFRTQKYSAQGKLLVNIKCGGKALDLDRSDGSVWVADLDGSRLRHYARDGRKLETSDRLPPGDKWIAVVPRKP